MLVRPDPSRQALQAISGRTPPTATNRSSGFPFADDDSVALKSQIIPIKAV
jgi:hypothetical protein